MRPIKWVATHKIVIVLPLLAFVSVGIFILAYDRVEAEKTVPVTAQSDRAIDKPATVEPTSPAALPDQIPANTSKVVSRLINEGIQMQEVQRNGYRVDSKVVDQELAEFMTQKELDLAGLKASPEKNGYAFDYFMKRFENRVLLSQYLEEKVFNDTATDYDKQSQYQAWFNNARVLSKVTIYDKELNRLSQSASSGGGCCPTS
jgi:parvulin-like peptidyl-prolyl isomerase